LPSDVDFKKSTAGGSGGIRKRNRFQFKSSEAVKRRDRDQRYFQYAEILDNVPELDQALKVLVDFVFGGNSDTGVSTSYGDTTTPAQRDIMDAAWSAVGGPAFWLSIFNEGVGYGDSFTELIYSRAGLIGERSLPKTATSVGVDEYGRLKGYTVAQEGASTVAANLEPWQVLHYAPDRARNSRYGRSLFVSARKLCRQSEAVEDVMSILALLQAAERKSVAICVPAQLSAEKMDAYLDSLANNFNSTQMFDKDGKMRRGLAQKLCTDDAIYPYREGVPAPEFHNETPTNLPQIVQVLRYYQVRYFIASGVPPALCGFEMNVNSRATLEQQGLQFVRTVLRRQQEVGHLVTATMMRAQAAAGVTPTDDFIVQMPSVSSFDAKLRAEIAKMNAETVKILGVDVGLDMGFVLSSVMGLNADEVALVAETAQAVARTARPGTVGEQTSEQFKQSLEAIADLVTGARKSGYGAFEGLASKGH
jgi:hypothetical protein